MNTKQRILAFALTTNGIGYAVMEGEDSLVDYGITRVEGDKNSKSAKRVEKLLNLYRPDVVVLPDVNAEGTHRAIRIQKLHTQVIAMTRKRKLKAVMISGREVRKALLNDSKGTKHEMATVLAERFPGELSRRLPAKRKAWDSENRKMDMFEAVGLAVVFWMRIR